MRVIKDEEFVDAFYKHTRFICFASLCFSVVVQFSLPSVILPASGFDQSTEAVVNREIWAWAFILYPILPPSLISRTVSVDVKHHGVGGVFESPHARLH